MNIFIYSFIHPSRVYYELTIRPPPSKWIYSYIHLFILHGYITNSQYDHLPVGLIAQLVEHCTGIAEVMGSNPVQAWIFFRLSFRNCLSCVVTARIFLLFDLSPAVQIYVPYIYIHLKHTLLVEYSHSNCLSISFLIWLEQFETVLLKIF